MAEIVYSNGASSLLAASIDDDDLVVQVGSGEGALFPSPGAGQYFALALVNALGDLEICHCTSRASDLLTVTRGQEGTSAQSWTNGSTRCELRLTAGTMQNLLQKSGDVMDGDLDMQDNEIQSARVVDPVITGGQVVSPLRGTEDDSSNQIEVPTDGTRATASGSKIVTLADNLMTLLPISTILMWYGSLVSLPTGWQNCDGTNGTPDLRDAFPRGAGGALALGASGGAATAAGTTSASGGHTPTGAAAAHVLTTAEMPAHRHQLRGDTLTTTTNTTGLKASDARTVAGRTVNTASSYVDVSPNTGLQFMEDTGGGGGHSHTVSMDAVADHTHTVSSVATIPPYKAVYFIMKVA